MQTAIVVLFVFFRFVITANDDEALSQLTTRRLDYWVCLANEILAIAPKKIPRDEFATYIKGKCAPEEQRFRSALIDYFSKKLPSMQAPDHQISADLVISNTQDDAADVYDDLNRQ